jgi:hypothetical protein
MTRRDKARRSFLKKRTKKLLFAVAPSRRAIFIRHFFGGAAEGG